MIFSNVNTVDLIGKKNDYCINNTNKLVDTNCNTKIHSDNFTKQDINKIHSIGLDGYIELEINSPSNKNYTPLESLPFQKTAVLNSGLPDEQSIVIVLMGDGYTSNQQDLFIERATSFGNFLTNFYPYNLFSKYFTVYAIQVVSNQSGVSKDYGKGESNKIVDNYFGSSFYYDSVTDRLLFISPEGMTKARNLMKLATPYGRMIGVLANSDTYGGAGLMPTQDEPVGIAVTSVSDLDDAYYNYRRMLTHEFGHSFGSLADEYFSGQVDNEHPNISSESNSNTIKWSHWIGYESVGVYPIGQSVNFYIPHKNCHMMSQANPYCMVCASELLRRLSLISNEIYQGKDTNPGAIQPSMQEVVIPTTANRILPHSFAGNKNIKKITISSNINSIGDYAFLNAESLRDIVFTKIMNDEISINSTVFSGIDKSKITLHLPKGGASDSQWNNAGWNGVNFVRIDDEIEQSIKITIIDVKAISREYNGTNLVELTGGRLVGIKDNDNVNFILGNGTMKNSDVGQNKEVTTNIQLTGINASNYILIQPNDITVNIIQNIQPPPIVEEITGLRLTEVGDNLQLNWNNSQQATEYRVYKSLNDEAYYLEAELSKTLYVDNGAINYKNVKYFVRAVNNGIESKDGSIVEHSSTDSDTTNPYSNNEMLLPIIIIVSTILFIVICSIIAIIIMKKH
ncbi:MAG: M64 family metallo-endopeptidase [Firmicutes bacterium]|nr:M64 family metallo-endopeptidase [Bacillota bacterium]